MALARPSVLQEMTRLTMRTREHLVECGASRGLMLARRGLPLPPRLHFGFDVVGLVLGAQGRLAYFDRCC